MKFDRHGVVLKDGSGWYWPFPRLRFRLRYGCWCNHKVWEPSSQGRPDGWDRVDYQTGRMARRCDGCKWVEWR